MADPSSGLGEIALTNHGPAKQVNTTEGGRGSTILASLVCSLSFRVSSKHDDPAAQPGVLEVTCDGMCFSNCYLLMHHAEQDS